MSAVLHTRPETTGNSPRNGGHMNYVELPDAVRRLYPWPGQYLALADRHRMHFIDEGQGETVLMVHGNPTWSFYYRNLIRAFSIQRRCVVPDHIGCGLSDKPRNEAYRLAQHIDNLDQLVCHLDLRDITLVVHDWGGPIGLGAALRQPERYQRLVIFNSAVFQGKIPLRIRMCRWPLFGSLGVCGLNAFLRTALHVGFARGARREVAAGYLAPYDSWHNRSAILRFVRDIPVERDHPTWSLVEDLDRGTRELRNLPAIILWGERDFVFTKEILTGWETRFPAAEVHRFPQAAHFVVEDAQDEIVSRLEDFFARHPLSQAKTSGQTAVTPTFNAASQLRAHATEYPSAPALRVPSTAYTSSQPVWDTVTFRELDRLSDAYARGLAARGVRAGDRAVVLFKPSIDFFAVGFALFKLGAVPVLLDPGMGLTRLLRCIEQAAARVVVAVPIVHVLRLISGHRALSRVELRITVGTHGFLSRGIILTECRIDSDEPFPLAGLQGTDEAALLFTSGSTGPPKGVVATQQMFQAQLDGLGEMLNLRPGLLDVQAFAAFAMYDISAGMCSVLPNIDMSRPAAADPAEIVAAITVNAPERAFGSPIIWHKVARYCLANRIRLPSLRIVLTVGAPVPAYLHRQFQQILSNGAEILTPYGATEALPVTCIGSSEILEDTWQGTVHGEGTCVGRPALGIDIHIIAITDEAIDSWHDDLALAQGEVGEVVVGGLQVSPAYHGVPQSNRLSKIRCGDRLLHRMGDIGYLDSEGRLWFCGRKVERLETKKGMIPPVPVEGVFNEHPDVFRTALVGVGDPGCQVPVLCVEMESGRAFTQQTVEGLRGLAEGTRYAGLVEHFLPHTAFPTDARHNSKIRREDLRRWASKRVNGVKDIDKGL